jgi:hypothetical protein
MMSRIHYPPGPDPHEETRELLPWLANGTLADAELERVQAHLDACAACRGQLGWEQGLRAAGQPEPPLSAAHAFAALLPRLGAQESGLRDRAGGVPRDPPAATPQHAPGGHDQGRPGRWTGLAAANDPRWLRTLAALQLCIIAALGLALAQLAPHGGEAAYRTLGAQPAAAGNIVVSFDAGTPERELRRILQASGGRVVDGPTATGAWILAIPPGAARPALARLRAEPGVTLAEPLAAESGR